MKYYKNNIIGFFWCISEIIKIIKYKYYRYVIYINCILYIIWLGRMGNGGGGGILNCYVYCILYKLIRNKLDYVILEFERKVK